LKTLTAHPKIQSSPTPLTKSLVGVIKSTSDHDWKAEWTEGFAKNTGYEKNSLSIPMLFWII
jgi:hypothetical protein